MRVKQLYEMCIRDRQNAEGKLERKNFDFIVLNSLNDAGTGFRHNTNKISIIDRKGRTDQMCIRDSYDIDPLKQRIADSWPDSLDDTCAREEWGWKPAYDLETENACDTKL